MAKYEYLYNKDNVLTHYDDAIRGEDYKLYKHTPLDYVFKEGKERAFFTLKYDNPFFSVGGGESIEHYNAKMEIAHDNKYYDTIFKSWVEFDKVIPEQKQNSKIPDLSCYVNDVLVCCIEIHNTNKKTDEDIEELKKLNVPVIEININNENRCEHIILPALFESNKREYRKLTSEIDEINIPMGELETERDIKREIKVTEDRIRECRGSIEQTTEQIQSRLLHEYGERVAEQERRVQSVKEEIAGVTGQHEANENYILKANRNANELKNRIRERRNDFEKIAKSCEAEWFRNKWVEYKNSNIVQEIRYWLC